MTFQGQSVCVAVIDGKVTVAKLIVPAVLTTLTLSVTTDVVPTVNKPVANISKVLPIELNWLALNGYDINVWSAVVAADTVTGVY